MNKFIKLEEVSVVGYKPFHITIVCNSIEEPITRSFFGFFFLYIVIKLAIEINEQPSDKHFWFFFFQCVFKNLKKETVTQTTEHVRNNE